MSMKVNVKILSVPKVGELKVIITKNGRGKMFSISKEWIAKEMKNRKDYEFFNEDI